MKDIILAIHGGAGDINPETQDNVFVQQRLDAMTKMLQESFIAYKNNSLAVDLVEALVTKLEDYPGFNAGIGSVLSSAGTVEMDAAIMDGRNRIAGAVANITRLKNPIQAARLISEKTEHLMLASQGAEALCAKHGMAFISNEALITSYRKQQWEGLEGGKVTCIDSTKGTVGAVARDSKNNLAAATSTGGQVNKHPGRIGDTPIIGAGTWADNDTVAVSCTGDGEKFIRAAFGHEIDALLRYQRLPLEQAILQTLDKVKALDGTGGCIAIDRHGNGVLDFNTNAMYRGFVNVDGEIQVAVY